MTFLNQSVSFSLRPMSTRMGKPFGPTGQPTSNRIFAHITMQVSFTSLGAKVDQVITDTMNTAGVYTFRIQGTLHHSMGSLLPPPGEQPHFAQVYMFDSIQEQLQFHHETHPNLDLDILQLLSTVLREVNPYVQFWSNAGERIAENAQLTIRLKMLNPTVCDPRRYNRPTVDEVAAIIVQPENDDEPLDRDIIIRHRDTGELQR